MKLVSDASSAWRWWSIRLALFGAAVQAGWEALDALGMAEGLPDWAQSAITAAIFIGVVAGRLINQGGADDKQG